MLVLLSKRVERTRSTRGIELGGMFYTSDELMALRAELAAGNGQTGQLSVRYNPWDLGEIWVLSPLDNAYIKATAIDTAMKGMTEYQWRVLKRAIRERFDLNRSISMEARYAVKVAVMAREMREAILLHDGDHQRISHQQPMLAANVGSSHHVPWEHGQNLETHGDDFLQRAAIPVELAHFRGMTLKSSRDAGIGPTERGARFQRHQPMGNITQHIRRSEPSKVVLLDSFQ